MRRSVWHRLSVLVLGAMLAHASPGDWALGGYLRLRGEWNDSPRVEDRERYRMRLRFLGHWDPNQSLRFLGSIAATGTQRSPYQTLGDGDEDLHLRLNTAALRYQAKKTLWFFGKFSNPNRDLVSKGMLFDGDVNPEGMAAVLGSDQLGGTLGYYGLNDQEVQPRYKVFSAQLRGQLGSEQAWFFSATTYLLDHRDAVPVADVDLGEITLGRRQSLFSRDARFAAQWFHNFSSDVGEDHGWVASFDWSPSLLRLQLQYQRIEPHALQPRLAQDDFLMPAGFKGWFIGLSHQLIPSTTLTAKALSVDPLDGRHSTDWRYRFDIDIQF